MAVAGGTTGYADYAALANGSIQKPLVRLIQQSAQSIPSDVDTALTFGAASEDIDTHGFHDTSTNPSRITPSVPGYYRLTGTVWYSVDTDLVSYFASIGRNGSFVGPRTRMVLPATATSSLSRSVPVTAMLQANGSGDYFELFARQLQTTPGSLNTMVTATFASVFECEFLRSL